MARQHVVYRAVVDAALHHAEYVYLVGVARERAPAVLRERRRGRYLYLVVVSHRGEQLFFVAFLYSVPFEPARQNLRAAFAVVEARGVGEGLVVAVLFEARRVVQQPYRVGEPRVVLLVPFKRLRYRAGDGADAPAVLPLQLLHIFKRAADAEGVDVARKPFFRLFGRIHSLTSVR